LYLDGEISQEIQVNATPVPPKCTKRKGRSTLIRGKKRKLHFDSFPIQQDDNYPQPPSLELIEASSPPNSLHSDDDDVPPPFLELEKVSSSKNSRKNHHVRSVLPLSNALMSAIYPKNLMLIISLMGKIAEGYTCHLTNYFSCWRA
jgi:hypothetical protein